MDCKISDNVIIDTLNDLRLFTQTNYCKKYLKNNFKGISNEQLELHAEISSACFRQSFEYYDTANNSPITTSPLLYSYCLNNMAKGLTYLQTLDENILKNFKRHGFNISDSNVKNNLLDTMITVNKIGATKALLEITNSSIIENIDISFNDLIKRIPFLNDIYEKSVSDKSYVMKKTNDYEYILNGKLDENNEIAMLFKKINFQCGYNPYDNISMIWVPMSGQDFIKENKSNLMYLDYLIIPFVVNEDIKPINQLFITYLVIMGYGMLVRYNAHKWEKFIDSKLSEESVLISMSITVCMNIFFNIVHSLLFNYIYIEEKYDDEKVKKLLHENETVDIIQEQLVKRAREELRYKL